ncbi:hypothetical protein H0H87_012164 [Tephrocybe sp. NHM501043]|nr:hypothetical protein H0H87_012164 [Tephrocybe sp. NHM501043]
MIATNFTAKKIIHRGATVPTTQYLEPFHDLPARFITPALEVTKFCALSVIRQTNDQGDEFLILDWKDLISRVNSYPGSDLTFDQVQKNTINAQNQTIEVMVHKMVEFFKDALNVLLDAKDVKALKENILATFTDLKTAESKDWASWRSEEDRSNSSWEYRLLYSIPMTDRSGQIAPDYFYTLVTTTKLTADIDTKSEWWGLHKSAKKNFSADIDAMELIIGKTFTNPGK